MWQHTHIVLELWKTQKQKGEEFETGLRPKPQTAGTKLS